MVCEGEELMCGGEELMCGGKELVSGGEELVCEFFLLQLFEEGLPLLLQCL